MKFGTIGAGPVALGFAREALKAGHQVMLSNRRQRPGLELAPIVTIAKRQRKLQRLFVKGAHEIHVAGDRVDAAD